MNRFRDDAKKVRCAGRAFGPRFGQVQRTPDAKKVRCGEGVRAGVSGQRTPMRV